MEGLSMNERLIEVLSDYKKTLERKQRMVKRFHEKRKETELNIGEQINLGVLEAECHQLKTLIEDLEYIQKG
jgi:hypothetical protein